MAQQAQALEKKHGEQSPEQQWRVSSKAAPLGRYQNTIGLLIVGAVGSALLLPNLEVPTQTRMVTSSLPWVLSLLALFLLGTSLRTLILRSRSTWTLALEGDELVFTRGAQTLRLPLREIAVSARRGLEVKHPRGGFRVVLPDEGDAFLGELVERLVSGAEARIQQGGTLEGQGWRYDSAGLHWGTSEALPLSSLEAVALSHHRLAFWRRGEARPSFVMDFSGSNAVVLGKLLTRHLPVRPPPAPGGEWAPAVSLAERDRNQPGEVVPNFLLPGDAAGEHLRLRRGRYDAWTHVIIAALAQAVIAGALAHRGQSTLLRVLQVQPGAAEPLILPLCAAFGVLAAYFTFRDSWRCIEAVSSRACSGVEMLSMLYVPFGAFAYANVRLVWKLFRL